MTTDTEAAGAPSTFRRVVKAIDRLGEDGFVVDLRRGDIGLGAVGAVDPRLHRVEVAEDLLDGVEDLAAHLEAALDDIRSMRWQRLLPVAA